MHHHIGILTGQDILSSYSSISPLSFRSSLQYRELLLHNVYNIDLSMFQIESPHGGLSLNCLDVDKLEYQYALVGGQDGNISLFNLNNICKNQFRNTKTILKNQAYSKSNGIKGTSISGVQWFPLDCGAFASSSYDCTIKLWNTEKFIPILTFQFNKSVTTCRMHYDGHVIAGSVGNDIRLCDLNTGGTTHILSGHHARISSIDFCPSNRNIMVTSSWDRSVKIWDLRKVFYYEK